MRTTCTRRCRCATIASTSACGPILERVCSRSDRRSATRRRARSITALAAALEQPLLVETAATRESFLQAAPLVGRDQRGRAPCARPCARRSAGAGGTWLVGGESGVGKSRLLDEIRTRALVDGVLVVRGQAVSQGGAPVPRVARRARATSCSASTLNDAEAEVLKAVVPDIGDAPRPRRRRRARGRLAGGAIAAACSRSRRCSALQPGPVLVILEDSAVGRQRELSKLLAGWQRPIATLPILVLGSFRDDDAPDLPAAIKDANLLTLGRLRHRDDRGARRVDDRPAARRARRRRVPACASPRAFRSSSSRSCARSPRVAGGSTNIADAALPRRVISGGMQQRDPAPVEPGTRGGDAGAEGRRRHRPRDRPGR